MKNLFFCFLFMCFSFSVSFAQESEGETSETIVEEFSELVNKSNSYEEYKVIKKTGLEDFKKRLSTEISDFESEIENLSAQIEALQTETEQLKSSLESTQANLTAVETEKDSISFFGLQLTKATYQTSLFSVIGALILILVLVLLKFKSNNEETNEAKAQLSSVEADLEECKRKALERQQKLGRELQDYKNKLAKMTKS